MKVYVAARFNQRHDVDYVYSRLEKLGYQISHKWTPHQENWTKNQTGANVYGSNPAYAKELAISDINGVKNCDVFVLLHTEDGGQGKFIEYGAALAFGKPCVIVNPNHINDCMFFYFPNVYLHYDLDSAISMLARLKEQSNDR